MKCTKSAFLLIVSVVIAGCNNPRQDISHLRLIVDQLQQRFTVRAVLADAENVFGGGV